MKRNFWALVAAMGLLLGAAMPALADQGGVPNENAHFGQCVAMGATHCGPGACADCCGFDNFGQMVRAMARGEACPCPAEC